MTNTMRSNRVIAATVVAVLLVPMAATAADVQVAADVGIGTSDNILRKSTNARSETIEQVGLQFSVQNQSRRLSADIRGDLAYLNYDNNTYSSELVGNAGAAVRLGLIEDRLSWSLEDLFGQTRRDVYAVDTPLNRENVNYFSTGPNLALRLGGANHLLASARYGLVAYQSGLYDTSRYSAQLGIEHDLSAVRHLGLNFSHERVDPQGSSLFSTYNRQEAYGRYRLEGARTNATFDLGASRVDRSGHGDGGVLIRIIVSHRQNDISTIKLHAARQITDAGNSMNWNGGVSLPTTGLNTQSLAQTPTPYTSTFGKVDWELAGRRTSVVTGVGLYDESYSSGSQHGRKHYDGHVHASRLLTKRLSARVGFAYDKYEQPNSILNESHKKADMGLSWKVGRHLSMDLSGERLQYESHVTTGVVRDTRAWLKIRYEDVGSR